MIAYKNKFFLGLFMLLGFFVVLFLMFMPLFDGKNTLDKVDDLFNTVSKDSSYFIPDVKEEAEKEMGTEVEFESAGENEEQATRIAQIFQEAGATASAEGKKVMVRGDLGEIMMAAADDSQLMFDNNGTALQQKYGYNEKNVMYDWYIGIDKGQKDLTSNEEFDQSKALQETNERAVEPAYNYYGITASSPIDEILPITLALIGYISYTLWYGFALLFMFEGWGLKLEH